MVSFEEIFFGREKCLSKIWHHVICIDQYLISLCGDIQNFTVSKYIHFTNCKLFDQLGTFKDQNQRLVNERLPIWEKSQFKFYVSWSSQIRAWATGNWGVPNLTQNIYACIIWVLTLKFFVWIQWVELGWGLKNTLVSDKCCLILLLIFFTNCDSRSTIVVFKGYSCEVPLPRGASLKPDIW